MSARRNTFPGITTTNHNYIRGTLMPILLLEEVELLLNVLDQLPEADSATHCKLQAIKQKLMDQKCSGSPDREALHWLLKLPNKIQDGAIEYELIVRPTGNAEAPLEAVYFDQWCRWEGFKQAGSSLAFIMKELYNILKEKGVIE